MDNALRLKADLIAQYGELPFVAMLNKSDLSQQWEITEDVIETSSAAGVEWIRSSAKTGDRVGEAIEALAAAIMNSSVDP